MAGNGKVGGNGGIMFRIGADSQQFERSLTTANKYITMFKRNIRSADKIYRATGNETKRLTETYKIMGKQLDTLRAKEAHLQKQLRNAKVGTQAYDKLKTSINAVRADITVLTANMEKNRREQLLLNQETKKLRETFKTTNDTMKTRIEYLKQQGRFSRAAITEETRLREAVKKTSNIFEQERNTLRKVRNELGISSKEYAKQQNVVERARLEHAKYKNALSQAGKATEYMVAKNRLLKTSFGQTLAGIKKSRAGLAELRNAMMSFGAGMTALTFPMRRAFTGSIGAVIEWEESFAMVRKTVGDASEKEFAQLDKDIMNMSKRIPETANSIAETMGLASQLGIAKENLSGFTETAIQMGVATNMSIEDASSAMARFANVTGMEQTKANFDKLGSTIVNLGEYYCPFVQKCA